MDRAEAGESGRDLHLPTSGRCLIDARLADAGPLHGIHRRQAMKAKLLLILLAVAIATGSMTACKKKSAAAPATGKESTAVDTTMKK
jgi:predicted nucleic acid binding AN1-type Zn finger protein